MSVDVQRAMRDQTNLELLQRSRRYAEARSEMVREAGRAVPQSYPRELVHDAYVDTWTGTTLWDPARCSLLVHLRGVIRQRTWSEARHGRRFPHRRLGPSTDTLFASSGDVRPLLFVALVARVCTALRDASAGDFDALAVLSCWERGVVEREEILCLTGLDVAAYIRTRKRLLHRCEELPGEIVELVRDELRRAS